jgi:hypothetical protein
LLRRCRLFSFLSLSRALDPARLSVVWFTVGKAAQQLASLVVGLFIFLDSTTAFFNFLLVVLRVKFTINGALRARGDHLKGGVSNDNGQTE